MNIKSLRIGEMADDFFCVVICPICENKTLDNHYICECCGWEYDGGTYDKYSCANRSTPKEYRKKYEKMLKRMGRENV